MEHLVGHTIPLGSPLGTSLPEHVDPDTQKIAQHVFQSDYFNAMRAGVLSRNVNANGNTSSLASNASNTALPTPSTVYERTNSSSPSRSSSRPHSPASNTPLTKPGYPASTTSTSSDHSPSLTPSLATTTASYYGGGTVVELPASSQSFNSSSQSGLSGVSQLRGHELAQIAQWNHFAQQANQMSQMPQYEQQASRGPLNHLVQMGHLGQFQIQQMAQHVGQNGSPTSLDRTGHIPQGVAQLERVDNQIDHVSHLSHMAHLGQLQHNQFLANSQQGGAHQFQNGHQQLEHQPGVSYVSFSNLGSSEAGQHFDSSNQMSEALVSSLPASTVAHAAQYMMQAPSTVSQVAQTHAQATYPQNAAVYHQYFNGQNAQQAPSAQSQETEAPVPVPDPSPSKPSRASKPRQSRPSHSPNASYSPRITGDGDSDTSFSAPQQAKRHPCLHPGCGKAFSTAGHLARHSSSHSGERPHECPLPGCGKRFGRKDNMMAHYRNHSRNSGEAVPDLPPPRVRGRGANNSGKRDRASPGSGGEQLAVEPANVQATTPDSAEFHVQLNGRTGAPHPSWSQQPQFQGMVPTQQSAEQEWMTYAIPQAMYAQPSQPTYAPAPLNGVMSASESAPPSPPQQYKSEQMMWNEMIAGSRPNMQNMQNMSVMMSQWNTVGATPLPSPPRSGTMTAAGGAGVEGGQFGS